MKIIKASFLSRFVAFIIAISGSVSLCAQPLANMPEPAQKRFEKAAAQIKNTPSKGLKKSWTRIPPGKLLDKLESLPSAAQTNANNWLNRINFHDHDVPFMNADSKGAIFFADEFQVLSIDNTQSQTSTYISASSNQITAEDAFTLHSKPGSSNVAYLDFNGHVLSNLAWNSEYDPLIALPYDMDGDNSSFNATELNNIVAIWRRVAEDYAAFDIDITTEEPNQFTNTVGRILITENHDALGNPMPASHVSGLAYTGHWGLSNFQYYSPALVYSNNSKLNKQPSYIAETVSHELGHNLGLAHDGSSSSAYYYGHGSGDTSWAPIMGVSLWKNVTQWSKGEYADANQFQDDVSVIASKVGFRNDDHGNQTSTATPLAIDLNGVITSSMTIDGSTQNKGTIHTENDIDFFSFNTDGGNISIQATPALESTSTNGANLDIRLTLYDSSGISVAHNNPSYDLAASLQTTVDAGDYYIAVDGDGSQNYTDYGSLGRYSLQGNISNANDVTPPSPNPMGWQTPPAAVGYTQIDMEATTATDQNSATEYYFQCISSLSGCVASGWISNPFYSATGLSAATTYSFRVKARDAFGNETAYSPIASATTFRPISRRPSPVRR